MTKLWEHVASVDIVNHKNSTREQIPQINHKHGFKPNDLHKDIDTTKSSPL